MKTIMTVSGKGGVGKTTVSLGAAAGLARRGRSVLLTEADPGFGSIYGVLGCECPVAFALDDLLAGRCTLAQAACRNAAAGVSIVAAPGSPGWLPPAGGFAAMAAGAQSAGFDYLIFDCAPGFGAMHRELAGCCSMALIVAQPNADCVRSCSRVAYELAPFAGVEQRLVINRVPRALPADCGLADLDEVIDTVRARLICAVPDQRIPPTDKLGVYGYPADMALINLADRLDGEAVPLLPVIR